jgi:hypothetical protein
MAAVFALERFVSDALGALRARFVGCGPGNDHAGDQQRGTERKKCAGTPGLAKDHRANHDDTASPKHDADHIC